ncbi:hypothetical protein DW701_02875 [Bacteroides eggerthii]|uniref:Uncharacterized protein n=1 Tax=Bacteroides eggerthii TaxID=28111 RepID=A0A414MJ95_9BACE|nr:hypothetical protein DW701_02875 [Bacteroides eggerthii]
MNGCQIITTKRGNSSNSLDFKEVYSLYRFTQNLRNKRLKRGKRRNVFFSSEDQRICSELMRFSSGGGIKLLLF